MRRARALTILLPALALPLIAIASLGYFVGPVAARSHRRRAGTHASRPHEDAAGTHGGTRAPAGSDRGEPLRYRSIGCEVRGPTLAYRSGPARKEIALSFDDGPYPLTPQFVAMLHANHAVATFFMIGRQVTASDHATLLAELRDGDALGDHTWSHPDLVTAGAIPAQLRSTLVRIRTYSGYTPCVFRPPYGDYDAEVLRTARSLGLATVLWDVDPADYTLPGVAAIVQRVLAQVQPGSIVLSHDGGGPRAQTLAAYPAIIRALRARGYSFVTVPQLLGFRPIYRVCRRDCEGVAVTGPLPPGAILQRG